MKKFISNNWKKILIFIGSVFIIMNVFSKIITEKTLLSDYVKYGKDIERPEILENIGNIAGNVNVPESPVEPDMMKILAFVGGGILFVIILTTLIERLSAKPKKK